MLLRTGECSATAEHRKHGEKGGREGVKLEQQVLVTAKGPQVLTTYPFEETLFS